MREKTPFSPSPSPSSHPPLPSLRLALLISTLRAGGAERVMAGLANHWANQGHEVFLITLVPPEEKPFYEVDPRVRVLSLDLPFLEKENFFKVFKIAIHRIIRLRKQMQKIRPSVCVSFLTAMNLAILCALKGLDIPTIVSERIDPRWHDIPTLYKKIRLVLYPWASRIVVQTSSVKSYFPESLQKLISIIPNSVKKAPENLVTGRLKNKPEAFPERKEGKEAARRVQNLISMGRLDLQKDHAILIRAFAHIQGRFPNSGLRLTIYGEGPERENLEALIAELSLQDKVFLPGLTQDVYKVLSESDLFVFPSRYEGFPNALAEAMSVGLPVIASNCSGNVDLVRDGLDGRLFPVGDETALTQCLEELLQDPAQRQRLGQKAREVIDRFSEAKILAQWDEVIFETIPA